MKKTKKYVVYSFVILLCLGVVGYGLVTNHPQIAVGIIQKIIYQDKSPNTFEPLYTPVDGIKENGQYLKSDIRYSNDYPNSFLDVIYPDNNVDMKRPTVFYFHGGGFFGGSKNMGDPLVANGSTYLIDDIVSKGYNVVNVDYAFVPEYHFPTPLIQMNAAISYMIDHAKEYHLDMNNVVLMGSSAGAIMVAQYGSIVSNSEYAKRLDITPKIVKENIKALVIDDAPLEYEKLSLAAKLLVGNYVSETIYLTQEEITDYNPILHVTTDYPPSFLLGSEYRKDMVSLHDALERVGVVNKIVDPFAEKGITKSHGFISNLRKDDISQDAFQRLITFLEEKTKE
ncbi:alpha/beta hydrolase [Streptococcus saliviloxodontae]|uniref:Acetyl esterase/lipase n=1 Tax=Streptococcus saliviloxodontae TaxID=1349416 RepID=A0ABS2PNF6_9STRE|nr:alpha/beta hydrolase [Streptococcus saliviloxodontae]MBM7636967.1 acetyl esterase/lipase [Streptococcus saliviloxodontae]